MQMKKPGYWDNFENLRKEILEVAMEVGNRMPTKNELRERNKGQIYSAISKHGGMDLVAEKLNLTRKKKRSFSKEIIAEYQKRFIENSKRIHGLAYDYSKVVYQKKDIKVEIICGIHGSFWQTPNDHTNKTHPSRCPDCAEISRREKRRKDLKEFINKANERFGSKYDYSYVEIVNVDTEVIIGCPKHGLVPMTPYFHIKKSINGCKKCGREQRALDSILSESNFIRKSKEFWGEDKYDYSEMNYKGVSKKLSLRCIEHNEINTIAGSNHLLGQQCCEICRGRLKLTYENFLERSYEKHGKKYDYSKVVLDTVNSRISIICNDHEEPYEFNQVVQAHLAGRGCQKCAGVYNMSNKEYIEKAISIHGHKFDYSKTSFENYNTPIIVDCPEHDEITILPRSHLNGVGCRLCSYKIAGEKSRKSEMEFLAKAKKIHGSNFDYSDGEYISFTSDIKIKCLKHNKEITTTPLRHIASKGGGCNQCSKSLIESTTDFIQRANEIHDFKYEYPLGITEYINACEIVEYVCPKHGIKRQVAYYHLAGNGCQDCGNAFQFISKESQEVFNELKKTYPDLISESDDQNIAKLKIEGWKGYYDAMIPSMKLLVEYDGSFYHQGREKIDIQKNNVGIKNGYSVVRIRQKPLQKISEYDILVPEKFDLEIYIHIVLDHLERFEVCM